MEMILVDIFWADLAPNGTKIFIGNIHPIPRAHQAQEQKYRNENVK
jgi:hypothetical protein